MSASIELDRPSGVGVDQQDAIRRAIEKDAVLSLALTQSLLGPLAFGEIVDDRTAHHHRSARVTHRTLGQPDRNPAAVLGPQFIFVIGKVALGQEAGKIVPETCLPLLVQQIGKQHLPDHFIPAVTQPGQLRLIDPDNETRRVQGMIAAWSVVVEVGNLGGPLFNQVV